MGTTQGAGCFMDARHGDSRPIEITQQRKESKMIQIWLNCSPMTSAPIISFGSYLTFFRCSCCLPSRRMSSSAAIWNMLVFSIFIIGSSCAWESFVSISAGFKLCGIQRKRPLHRARLSWMMAISSADLSSSPDACSEAAPSNSDLASTIASDNGSWWRGSSEASTVGSPCIPESSSSKRLWRTSYREILILSQVAICFSKAPSAVDKEIDSHSIVEPAFLRSLLDFQPIKEMGAGSPWLSFGLVMPCNHPCCGLVLPVGSKEASAMTTCLTSFSGIGCIRSFTEVPLIFWTTLFVSKAWWTLGPGNDPAKIEAAAAASGRPSRAAQFKLAIEPRSCASSDSFNAVSLAFFRRTFRSSVTGRRRFWV